MNTADKHWEDSDHKPEDINAELLAACKRSVQYLVWAIHDCEQQGLQDTISIAKRDLEMVNAAITKAEGET